VYDHVFYPNQLSWFTSSWQIRKWWMTGMKEHRSCCQFELFFSFIFSLFSSRWFRGRVAAHFDLISGPCMTNCCNYRWFASYRCWCTRPPQILPSIPLWPATKETVWYYTRVTQAAAATVIEYYIVYIYRSVVQARRPATASSKWSQLMFSQHPTLIRARARENGRLFHAYISYSLDSWSSSGIVLKKDLLVELLMT
jgi:hypothetical protein